MSENEIERTPDYKALIGKKILSLHSIFHEPIDVASLVLVFEAKDEYNYGRTDDGDILQLSEMRWKIAPPSDWFFRQMYTEGIYKLVGVGIVISREGAYSTKYTVALNDDMRAVFRDEIPF